MRTLPLILAAAACSPALENLDYPTGSSTIAVSAERGSLLTLDADAGLVVQLSKSGDKLGGLDVGGEPSRIAPIGATGRFAVTLRATRQVAIVEASDSGPTLVQLVTVGAEPVGVVADEPGTRLYVALSTEDRVVELDATTLEVLRSFEVGGQPRWLALRPGGHDLYTMSAYGGVPTWIDLDDGTVTAVPLPELDHDYGPRLTPRLTGDPSVSFDGGHLVIPALYVDNQTEEAVDALFTPSLYYSSYGKWNPVIVSVPLEHGGAPRMDYADVMSVTVTRSGGLPLGSYPSSVTLGQKGLAYVTLEASDAVVALRAHTDAPDAGARIVATALSARRTVAGPRGVAISEDEAWVQAALDHVVQPMDGAALAGEVEAYEDEMAKDSWSLPTPILDPIADTFPVADVALPVQAENGRKLFMSADNPLVVSRGAGVSCGTCHFDGRNDGLTWPLNAGQRQTPSLAGHVSDTLPVTWTSEVETIEGEVAITSENRMGGQNMSDEQRAQIAAYVDTIRLPDVPLRGAADPAIARGEALFESADVGCASCHAGPALTDRLPHDLYGLPGVDTPSLRGIAATAPYAHDGRFATLGELLADGTMGNTNQLSASERADLEAYLKSL